MASEYWWRIGISHSEGCELTPETISIFEFANTIISFLELREIPDTPKKDIYKAQEQI
jgi:hypothetical protein